MSEREREREGERERDRDREREGWDGWMDLIRVNAKGITQTVTLYAGEGALRM